MTTVDFLEIAMRGGAVALIFVLAAQLTARRPVPLAAWLGCAFILTAAVYAIGKTQFIYDQLGSANLAVEMIAIISPVFFWLFILALVDDEFRFRPWMVAPFVAVEALRLICLPYPEVKTFAEITQLSIVFVMMGHLIWRVRCTRADDLVDSRRNFTRTLSLLVPFIAIAIIGIEILEITGVSNDASRLGISAVLLVIAVSNLLTMSTLRKTLMPEPQAPVSLAGPVRDMTAADRIDLGRLRDLMEEGVYLNAGLTIGGLAGSLNVPEHRLRKLINQGLGYRNFAAFVNDHRIAEARKRLAEPSLVHNQITNLAYDVGFASLAPFNRAFRERTGMSPSEYRENTLVTGANDAAR